MRIILLLFIVVLATFAQAQTKEWEQVMNAPDTCRISPSVQAISTDDALFLYQQDAGVTFVSKSVDGIHFTSLGTLDASLGSVLPMFSWRNEIYLRTSDKPASYLKSTDGINFQTFLPQDKYNKYLNPVAFGIVRDTLYAYCSSFQKGDDTRRDSLYFVDENNHWIATYGKAFTEYYSVICMQGKLVLNGSGGYLDFYSLQKAPRIVSKTEVSFNPQRWSAGKYIISYDYYYNFNDKPALLLTDLQEKTSLPLPLPQQGLASDEFSLLVMPDSSLILKNRNQVNISGSSISYVFIYRTHDWGNSWTVIDSFPQDWRNKEYLSFYTYKNDWYITNSSLPYRRSTDKGQSWKKVMLYGTRWNTKFVSADGKMLLNDEYFSNDDGKTWELYAEAFPQYTPQDVFWRDNQLGWFLKENDIFYYQIKPGANTLTFAGSSNGHYYREAQKVHNEIVYLYRGGYADFKSGSFYRLNQSNKEWALISDLKYVLSADPAMYLLSDGQNLYYYDIENSFINGVFTSSDNGQSWTLLTMPEPLVSNKKPRYSFYDDRSNHLYMGMRESDGTNADNSSIDTLRIFRITPNGYLPVAANGFVKQPLRQNFEHQAFQNLITFPASGVMYSWSQDAKKRFLRLFKSADMGENWEQIDTDQIVGTVLNIGEDLNGLLYIATSNGLFREKKEDVMTHVNDVRNMGSLKLVVYPNPALGSVTVSGGNKNENIQVVDLYGHVLIHAVVSENESHLDISSLSPGIYIIKTGVLSEKLIVQ